MAAATTANHRTRIGQCGARDVCRGREQLVSHFRFDRKPTEADYAEVREGLTQELNAMGITLTPRDEMRCSTDEEATQATDAAARRGIGLKGRRQCTLSFC